MRPTPMTRLSPAARMTLAVAAVTVTLLAFAMHRAPAAEAGIPAGSSASFVAQPAANSPAGASWWGVRAAMLLKRLGAREVLDHE